ncbi:MAG: primosomal protein N' [Lachnospiraceae bacterium]|nr:primosomal protein N' [Lachnospiraceae bacterium]
MTYCEVALANEFGGGDRTYDYALPKELEGKVNIGMRVIVPFGRRNNMAEAFVVALRNTTDVPEGKIKAVVKVIDKEAVFSADMLSLAIWMRERYFSPLSRILSAMLPSALKTKRETVVYICAEWEDEELSVLASDMLKFIDDCGGEADKNTLTEYFGDEAHGEIYALKVKGILKERRVSFERDNEKTARFISLSEDEEKRALLREKAAKDKRLEARIKVIDYLEKNGDTEIVKIKNELGLSDSPINTLVKDKIALIKTKVIMRGAINAAGIENKNIVLNKGQQEAICTILDEFDKDEKTPVYVYGITGSGKTEVYIKAVEKAIENGGQAIMLVPEISLTSQMVDRFCARFGDKVSLTHSRLSSGERIDQWKKAKKGEISVMIGPRSAVFTPFENLKLIIADEEHEPSYRCDMPPRYDTVEVAEKLCSIKNAVFVMGSATPSVENFSRAKDGHIKLCTLKERPVNAALPEISVVDMRRELMEGNRSMFSSSLRDGIAKALEEKRQIILFINRRGYSSFVSCRKCGYVMECTSCNVNYTYHRSTDSLVCHYCGKRAAMPKVCPECGSKCIRHFGTGTQKIEQEIKRTFPEARVLRMDKDTTARKHSHEDIIRAFSNREADILIGTQMVAKGLDFPGVSLVGVMAADMSLNTGDFRSQERTFELITQVAGRAGRADDKGRVIVQTYAPENYSILTAARQDYQSFYDEEIKMREMMEYPPFKGVYLVSFAGSDEKKVCDTAESFKAELLKTGFCGSLLGPAPEYISKIKGDYRYSMYIKGEYKEIKEYLHKVYDTFTPVKDVRFFVTALSREVVTE